MISDSVMVGLLKESIMSRSPVSQIAARMMLDLARSGDLELSARRMEVLRAEAGPEVADAVSTLADQLGLLH